MIVDHIHQILYIKTRKTASTSIELWLADQWCGDQCIITPISPEDERRRKRNPQNYLWGATVQDGLRLNFRFYNHMPISELNGMFSGYFSFTFERHPYEKVVSQYFYLKPSHPDLTIDTVINKKMCFNYPLYAHSETNQILVDKVWRFEELEDRLTELSEKLGIKYNGLPKAKTKYRPDVTVDDCLSSEQKDQIYNVHKPEFDLMNYER